MHTPNPHEQPEKSSRRRFLAQSAIAVAGLTAVERLSSTSALVAQESASSLPVARKPSPLGCAPETREALSGPWPSIHTPFTRDGQIDFDALRRQIDFAIDTKAKAVVLTWGDSLFSILTDDEISDVTEAVVKHVNRRVFVVAATGTWWMGKAVAFAKHCRDIGADMLMALPPDWAGSTTLDSLIAYYRAVAEQIPVMLVTNYLGARGAAFGLELCGRLYREVPGVVALKDDVGGEFINKVCMMTHDRWALSAGGQKQNHLQMLPYGVDGYLSTFMTFKPEIAWRYWTAITKGDLAAARQVVRDYDMPLFDYIIKSEGGFDAAIHGIHELYGLGKRYRRPPYHSLTDKQMDDLAQFLKSIKV